MLVVVDNKELKANKQRMKDQIFTDKCHKEISLGKEYLCGYKCEYSSYGPCQTVFKLEEQDLGKMWKMTSDKHFQVRCPTCRETRTIKFESSVRVKALKRLAIASPIALVTLLVYVLFLGGF
jgi:hypothetical protein